MTEAVIGAGSPGFPYSDEVHWGRLLELQTGFGTAEGPRWAIVGEHLLSGSVDLSTTQVSQATIRVWDPDGEFRDGPQFRRRALIDFGGLPLELAAREMGSTAGRPTLALTCRARAPQAMKRSRGALVRRNISPTSFMAAEAQLHGARFIGQQSPARTQIVRAVADPAQGGENETSWSIGERLAKELGYLFFEAQGTIYFAQPTWLVERLHRVPVRWDGETSSGFLLKVPELRESDNDEEHGFTGTLELAGEAAAKLTPGRAVLLTGVGSFSATYLVTGLRMELGTRGGTGTVSIATPVNPKPEGTAEERDAKTTAKREQAKEQKDALDEQLARLRQCESGGNYKANTGNGYYGAYQFDLSTWRGLGYSGRPDQATPATQDAAARKLHGQRGWQPWPTCSRKLGLK